jgi:hypothetical protein
MPSDEEVTQRAESLRAMTGLTVQEFTADPDGGLARPPLEESPAPCLPPPKAKVPRHATG